MVIDSPPKILKRNRSNIIAEGEHDVAFKKFKGGEVFGLEGCLISENFKLGLNSSAIVSREILFLACVDRVEETDQPKDQRMTEDNTGRVIWRVNIIDNHDKFDTAPILLPTQVKKSLFAFFGSVVLYLWWNISRKPNFGFLAHLNPVLYIYDCWISGKDNWSFKVTKAPYVQCLVMVGFCWFIVVVSWSHVLNKDKGLIEVHSPCRTILSYIDGLRMSPYSPLSSTQTLVLASVISRLS